MKIPPGHLTKKDLANRWGVCRRTVERRVAALRIRPAAFGGNWPLFTTAQVESMEKALDARSRAFRGPIASQGELFPR